MANLTIHRTATVPDEMRIARYRQAPEYGPRICFFTGGSALTDTSRALKAYTHQSTHLVTPFDSGGSSAALRHAFNMPAIGDLRNRLMALADTSVLGHPRIVDLFATRLPRDASRDDLKRLLIQIADGKTEEIKSISNPMRQLICNQLGYFLEGMPEDFDLRGANIGNLILAGGYLNNHNDLEPIVFLFSKLVNVLGEVRLTCNEPLHLRTQLQDGRTLVGQHLITGKEYPKLESPIEKLELVSLTKEGLGEKATPLLPKRSKKAIEQAELICYSPGSFFSSLLANLLITGVGKAIAKQACTKVYIPSLGTDPEALGYNTADLSRILLQTLKKDAGAKTDNGDLLTVVLLDSLQKDCGRTEKALNRAGIATISTPLSLPEESARFNGDLLSQALVSLV